MLHECLCTAPGYLLESRDLSGYANGREQRADGEQEKLPVFRRVQPRDTHGNAEQVNPLAASTWGS